MREQRQENEAERYNHRQEKMPDNQVRYQST
jgi:hypothetical protein